MAASIGPAALRADAASGDIDDLRASSIGRSVHVPE